MNYDTGGTSRNYADEPVVANQNSPIFDKMSELMDTLTNIRLLLGELTKRIEPAMGLSEEVVVVKNSAPRGAQQTNSSQLTNGLDEAVCAANDMGVQLRAVLKRLEL